MKVTNRVRAKKTPIKGAGRFHTNPKIRDWVWMRAAGHCELCGDDLTRDLRVGTQIRWGEAAHILPASPDGPRGTAGHTAEQAKRLTDDPGNLMLLCPGCHTKIDKDANDYPTIDMASLHEAQMTRIALAASSPSEFRAVPLIVLSQHFATRNDITDRQFLQAMSQEGLHAVCGPVRLVLPILPPSGERNMAYWTQVADLIHHTLANKLSRATADSADLLAVTGLADLGGLMMLGQTIGDRSHRRLYSPNRTSGMHWPDINADPPEFRFTSAPPGEGPLALVLSLSARIPEADVHAVLPHARIGTFSIDEPSYDMVKNRKVINAFRDELQKRLSDVEADTTAAIHLFMAIPAALAIEFGALLTTQHRHTYEVFDRSQHGSFEHMLTLSHTQKEIRP